MKNVERGMRRKNFTLRYFWYRTDLHRIFFTHSLLAAVLKILLKLDSLSPRDLSIQHSYVEQAHLPDLNRLILSAPRFSFFKPFSTTCLLAVSPLGHFFFHVKKCTLRHCTKTTGDFDYLKRSPFYKCYRFTRCLNMPLSCVSILSHHGLQW